jgi:hypothetical protein
MFDKRDQISSFPWLFLALTLGLTWFLEFLAASFRFPSYFSSVLCADLLIRAVKVTACRAARYISGRRGYALDGLQAR